jgi:2'-5' RNA ligase
MPLIDLVDQLAVVHFIPVHDPAIEDFRQAYDPTSTLIAVHLTLVFPVPASIGVKGLRSHVRRVAAATAPFDIRLRGVHLAADHRIFLLVRGGGEDVVRLHDALYAGILRPHLRSDIPFIPHVTIGLFTERQGSRDSPGADRAPIDRSPGSEAFEEAGRMHLDHASRVEDLDVIGLDIDMTTLTRLGRIPLGAPRAQSENSRP